LWRRSESIASVFVSKRSLPGRCASREPQPEATQPASGQPARGRQRSTLATLLAPTAGRQRSCAGEQRRKRGWGARTVVEGGGSGRGRRRGRGHSGEGRGRR